MVIDPTPYEALKACLEKAESQSNLARELGCSQTAVWKMLQTKRMSPQYVLTAERKFGVSRHDLRPDIYPREARFYGVDRNRFDRRQALG